MTMEQHVRSGEHSPKIEPANLSMVESMNEVDLAKGLDTVKETLKIFSGEKEEKDKLEKIKETLEARLRLLMAPVIKKLKNEKMLQRRHCSSLELDEFWKEAVKAGRAIVETTDEYDPFKSDRKHELKKIRYEVVMNSKHQWISLHPRSPEAWVLLEALEGKI